MKAGKKGTRDWTPEQIDEITSSSSGRAKFDGETMEGHHKYNALDHPQVAGDGRNIYPATNTEHFERWHGGNYQNDTYGKPLNPNFKEEF